MEVERRMDWKTLLAYITGSVDQALLLRNEYLVTENRILRNQIKGRVHLSDGERTALAAIGQKLGKQALQEVAKIVKPDTILGWHRTLVAQKFDSSQQRKALGRPKVDPALEALIVRMAQDNRSWGYGRIVGALANLGHTISDQIVGNILKRHGLPPAPERKTTTTWKEFIRTHLDVLVATDFFTTEVWTLGGLVRHEPHTATGAERLVVLLLHVVCTQRSTTDAAGAVRHKHLGTVLTDLTGALCRGRRHAHIRHFAGDTGAYLSHRLSPWA